MSPGERRRGPRGYPARSDHNSPGCSATAGSSRCGGRVTGSRTARRPPAQPGARPPGRVTGSQAQLLRLARTRVNRPVVAVVYIPDGWPPGRTKPATQPEVTSDEFCSRTPDPGSGNPDFNRDRRLRETRQAAGGEVWLRIRTCLPAGRAPFRRGKAGRRGSCPQGAGVLRPRPALSVVVLVGLLPLFYGGRKVVYASMGLGLVDDADQAEA